MKKRYVEAITVLALSFSVACRHRSPETILHTLHPLAPKADGMPSFAGYVEVMPIHLPELLQRPQLILPREAGGFAVSETHRWGNGLETDMQRVLVSNLSALLGSERAFAYRSGKGMKNAYRLTVDVLSCEGRSNTLHVEIQWTLSKPSTSDILLQRNVELQEPIKTDTVEALVNAYDRILSALAKEIATGLQNQAKIGP